MGPFDQLRTLPQDPIFGLSEQFQADKRTNKHTFVTGYFRNEEFTVPVLDTVADIEAVVAERRITRSYLPIDGDREFIDLLGGFVFGKDWGPSAICGVQTIGGTGALYLAAQLAKSWTKEIAISNHTWANHWNIFQDAGLKTFAYPYYFEKAFQIDRALEKLHTMNPYSCILLHTSCHNPTGCDLDQAHWREICFIAKKRHLFPILDMAYQGLAGTPDQDAFAPRLFLEEKLPFALTYTCAKNFSIYSERAGALFISCASQKESDKVRSNLKKWIRSCYSNPPIHGAAIVREILGDPNRKKRWLDELVKMRKRIKAVRIDLANALLERDPHGGWEILFNGKGLFFMSELPKEAIAFLREEKGLYLALDGRINLTAINRENLSLIVDALLEFR